MNGYSDARSCAPDPSLSYLSVNRLVLLVLLDHYTRNFGRAVMRVSSDLRELMHADLVTECETSSTNLYPYKVTLRGQQVLEQIGAGTIAQTFILTGRSNLMHLVEPKLTLADLSSLLVHKDEEVRKFAKRKYKELDLRAYRKAHGVVF